MLLRFAIIVPNKTQQITDNLKKVLHIDLWSELWFETYFNSGIVTMNIKKV